MCPFTRNQAYEATLSDFEALLAATSETIAEPTTTFPAEFLRVAAEDIRGGTAERAMTRRLQVPPCPCSMLPCARAYERRMLGLGA